MILFSSVLLLLFFIVRESVGYATGAAQCDVPPRGSTIKSIGGGLSMQSRDYKDDDSVVSLSVPTTIVII